MRLKIFCPPWLIASFCFILAVGNNSEEKSVKRERAAVYFPALPEAFNENFGKKSSRRSGFSKSLNENSPPISSPKPTTTTEKLPLAQERHHVARNSVTEAPGPTYLTESVYYQRDPTPSPRSDEELSISAKEHSLEEREREDVGVFLQSVSSFKPHFNGNRIILDPLMNPASMHYIPIESEESPNETPSEKIPPSSTFKDSSDVSLFSADEFSILVKTVPAPKAEEPTPPPRHYSENGQQPFVNYSVSFRNQRIKHTTTTTTTTTTTERPIRLYVPPSKLKKVEFNRNRNSNSKPIFEVRKSKGFLPKPAANPFAAKISQPVVKASYESPISSDHQPSPSTTTTTSALVTFPSKTNEEQHIPDYSTNLSKKKSNSFQHSFLSFGERKQKRIKPVKVHTSPSTKSPDDLSEQIRRDYGFDFSSATIHASRKELKKSFAPIEEAPIYHTSTKSYRAPSSLFQIRDSKGKSVTAPSQPDFIQTESNIYIPQEYDEEAIPGMAGIDYPIYASIPETKFACNNQDHPGLYADQQTKCQVFHICQEGGREDSFLCPNGTIFNQQYFVCDWWYNFSCESAERFYSLNALIYEFSDSEGKPTVYS